MFTRDFFNIQRLNFGKNLRIAQKLNKNEKKSFIRLINSIRTSRTKQSKVLNDRFKMLRSLGLLITMFLIIMAFEWKTYFQNDVVGLQNISFETQEILDIPLTVQPPPSTPQKMAVKIIEVLDVEVIEEEIDIDLDIETNELMVLEAVDIEKVKIIEEKPEEVFLIVEKSPTPVGGLSMFYAYLSSELNYPSAAIRANISGKVFVQFIVNKDGSLTDFIIIKGVGLGCDKEAIRVLKKAPKWIPGKQRGKEVRVRMIIPISFVLKN